MQGDIVAQGAELMLFGMGTVLLFLSLLVGATVLMSRLIERYFPAPLRATGQVPAIAQSAVDPRRVAVISAAIHRYRSERE